MPLFGDARCCVSTFFYLYGNTTRMKSEVLSDKEIRIMSCQIKLPGVGLAGQEKIKKTSVLVIGAGGKGTSALQNLVTAGIGYIGISDNYLVDEASLPRQNLYGEKDLGKQKAIISRQRLLEPGRTTTFSLHNICLSETNILNIITPYDIILDATDNFPAHYLINDAAIITGKPFVFGSVVHNTGLVSVFNYSGGPSFRCLYPQVPRNNGFFNDDGIPALGLLYNITGNLMAAETLKIILGHPSPLCGSLLRFKMDSYTCSFDPITRNEENFAIKGFG
jgi:sulfur-carrier protein adenylyltransferase/sulfurtransferase